MHTKTRICVVINRLVGCNCIMLICGMIVRLETGSNPESDSPSAKACNLLHLQVVTQTASELQLDVYQMKTVFVC